jgi:hypothetical protein
MQTLNAITLIPNMQLYAMNASPKYNLKYPSPKLKLRIDLNVLIIYKKKKDKRDTHRVTLGLPPKKRSV